MSESIDLENIHLAKIGVILDMDNGLICFLNPDSNNDIVSSNSYSRKNANTSKLQSYSHNKRSVLISSWLKVYDRLLKIYDPLFESGKREIFYTETLWYSWMIVYFQIMIVHFYRNDRIVSKWKDRILQ